MFKIANKNTERSIDKFKKKSETTMYIVTLVKFVLFNETTPVFVKRFKSRFPLIHSLEQTLKFKDVNSPTIIVIIQICNKQK